MRTRTPTPRQGFTLIELLVVISVIAILATLLFPAIGMVRTMANKAKDGNNVKQIVVSMTAYATDNNSSLPAAQRAGTAVTADQWQETIKCFEVLTAWSKGDVSAKLFKGPTAGSAWLPGDTLYPKADGSAWVADGTVAPMSYALDWSAPSDLKATRPVVGSRDPAYWGGDGINVAFGDGHYEFVRATGEADSETMSDDGTSMVKGAVLNIGDDLLKNDDSGYRGDITKISRGPATRAWLR
jgi:prepilin-type N-terminal cleavage/methylation domain-containing protein